MEEIRLATFGGKPPLTQELGSLEDVGLVSRSKRGVAPLHTRNWRYQHHRPVL